MATERQAEEQLLASGRDVLQELQRTSGGDPTKLAFRLKAMVDANEGPALAAGFFAALVDDAQPRRSYQGAAIATGAVAGTAGLSGDLYKAARVSRDVGAVERSVETGDPRYVERRVKNKIIGRALGRAGVWTRLWK